MGLFDCLCWKRRGCFVSVESIVYWLHYPGTVALLVIFFLITVTTCSLGEPVACATVDGDCPPSENKQCWNQFVASSNDDEFDGQVKAERIHPYTSIRWMFLVHILLISLPLFANFVVNTCDRTAQAVIERLQRAACQLDENDRDNDVNSAVQSFLDDNQKTSEGIAWLLSFCARNTRGAIACLKIILEVLMFASVLGSFCMIAGFLGYSVPQFQAMVDAYVSNGFRNNETGYPMYEAFPRMRDCVLDMPGPDGTTTKLTRNCLLSQNMVLENLIVFLWLWYIALMVVTAVFLAYRLWQRLDSKHHCSTLKACLKRTDGTTLEKDLTTIAGQCGFGHVLMLHNVGRRVDLRVFNDFLHGVGVELAKLPHVESGGDEEEDRGLTCDS